VRRARPAGTRIRRRRTRDLAKLSTLLVLALTILSSCGEGAPEKDAPDPRPGPQQSAGAPIDYRQLLRRLEQEGLRVEPLGRARVDFLQDDAYLARVEGDEVRVFEFKTADVAAGAAQRVSPDGYAYTTPSGGASVNWVAPPHFFRSGRTIVLYLGQRKRILQALSGMLGREFAGADTDP
jgi:hypothetical protein